MPFTGILKKTLNLQVGMVCAGQSSEDVVTEVIDAFPNRQISALQIQFEEIRVTFSTVHEFKTPHEKSDILHFGSLCTIQGGDPADLVSYL